MLNIDNDSKNSHIVSKNIVDGKLVRVRINENIHRTYTTNRAHEKTFKIKVKKRIKSQREIDQENFERRNAELKSRPLDYRLRELGLCGKDNGLGDENDEEEMCYVKVWNHVDKILNGKYDSSKDDPPDLKVKTVKQKRRLAKINNGGLIDEQSQIQTSRSHAANRNTSTSNFVMKSWRSVRRQLKASRSKGIRHRPLWLVNLSIPEKYQARSKQFLQRRIETLSQKSDSESELHLKLARKKNIMLDDIPKPCTYRSWTEHVAICLNKDKHHASSTTNDAYESFRGHSSNNYFRLDSIGWTKEDGYVRVLISTEAEKNAEYIDKTIKEILALVPNESKKSPRDTLEACKVLELGSGSGQHAIKFCEGRSNMIFQPSDISQRCIDSVKKRSKFFGLERSRYGNGQCLDCIYLNCLEIQKACKTLNDIESSGYDAMVVIDVISYASWQFTVNMWMLASKNIKTGGHVFLYGTFQTTDKLSENAANLDKRLKSLSPLNGVRLLDDVVREANLRYFELFLKIGMGGGNLGLIFKKMPQEKEEEYINSDEEVRKNQASC
eukprot:CAMPEP_0194373034 /NCGR_PEP_ID=MMETSP0174-20130528/21457_1 /TAXON_ID=216777 /ORGANISM="Proboscia alata, Strain PI-D3" /LENGTH=553 /DNA_ID=CAMNT_0039151885 /DNA_START=175 /DNA_END=1836 /DNA_ORIENTATION=-